MICGMDFGPNVPECAALQWAQRWEEAPLETGNNRGQRPVLLISMEEVIIQKKSVLIVCAGSKNLTTNHTVRTVVTHSDSQKFGSTDH